MAKSDRDVVRGILRWMRSRCENPNDHDYPRYGGRGIRICNRWTGPDAVDNFLADVGPRPSPAHSLDRYPNNAGHYEPGNVRWATPKQQQSNRSDNVLVTYRGEQMIASEFARRIGKHAATVCSQLLRGYTVEQIIAGQIQRRGRAGDGTDNSGLIAECKRIGISYDVVRHRIGTGWSVERALSAPVRPHKRKGRRVSR